VRLAPARATVAAPPLLFGVDAVPVERVRALLPAYGDRFTRRVATPAEATWAAGSAVRLATLLAVKESAVKCLAGRPEGFRWQAVELDPSEAPPATSGAVSATFEAFAAGVGLDAGTDVACRLTGVALDRGLALLAAAPWGKVEGVARYGTLGDTVLAVAAFWEDPA
jgi:holo-[acyl-carrier protein] synthase